MINTHKCEVCYLLRTYNLNSIRLQGLPVRPTPIPNLKTPLPDRKSFESQ